MLHSMLQDRRTFGSGEDLIYWHGGHLGHVECVSEGSQLSNVCD